MLLGYVAPPPYVVVEVVKSCVRKSFVIPVGEVISTVCPLVPRFVLTVKPVPANCFSKSTAAIAGAFWVSIGLYSTAGSTGLSKSASKLSTSFLADCESDKPSSEGKAVSFI